MSVLYQTPSARGKKFAISVAFCNFFHKDLEQLLFQKNISILKQYTFLWNKSADFHQICILQRIGYA